VVRRPDRAKLCSSVSARFAHDLEESFMSDVLSNVMLLDAFGLFEIFCWGLEAIHFRARADELARRERSRLALNFPSLRRLSALYCGSFGSKLLVS